MGDVLILDRKILLNSGWREKGIFKITIKYLKKAAYIFDAADYL